MSEIITEFCLYEQFEIIAKGRIRMPNAVTKFNTIKDSTDRGRKMRISIYHHVKDFVFKNLTIDDIHNKESRKKKSSFHFFQIILFATLKINRFQHTEIEIELEIFNRYFLGNFS